ncbi:exodeoxyribonuclease I [Halopseudomonas salegens]|uniref:Exodeoxyribonuclease I n=1 Tax=Halopseudomonas salegens TaxID=1434072 RepID=A0A1H2EIZ0_9GAMM|nr:exodeoxyribonuclease I [Halopseudomonas salegens]SDT95132.1 Exodeoxyribonuclease I subunit C [Halopseudomonas salegens]
MADTFFWYDFESTGIDPRRDRPLQVAGVRTDTELNEIAEPLCIDSQLSPDILPHPQACLVTGIGPDRAMAGLPEAEFIERLQNEMMQPGTCSVGYNSLRFDDEMARFSFYRNFHDPYAREWQGGNSRWDLIDALRAAHALRPEGIEWPEQDGFTSLRLERLTAANGIDHGQAHDALADVRATIAMARLLRQAQPRLYGYLLGLRNKRQVASLIDLQGVRPLVHVSGRFGRERQGLGVVLPLAWHPHNRNALIVYDLTAPLELLMDLDADQLRARLYTANDDLAPGEQRPGLKLVHINKCPVLADTKVLRPEDCRRLQVDLPAVQAQADVLAGRREQLLGKLHQVYSDTPPANGDEDAETQLYAGFISDQDRRLLPAIRQAGGEALGNAQWSLQDQRLQDLLFRYQARNFPESLSASQLDSWMQFCRQRLLGEVPGAPRTWHAFNSEMEQAMAQASEEQKTLLNAWKSYSAELADYLKL